MLERRERVEQWARREEQGADSRSHARAGLGGEAVAGGSAAAAEERRSICEQQYMVGGHRFFVSHVVLCSVLGRAVHVAKRVSSQASRASVPEAPSALPPRPPKLSDVPGPRPVFQLCCIQFLSSQHVQGL